MMKKLFHVLIALGSLVFFVAGLIFVFGQALCIVLGQPEWIIQLESSVDGVIFPAIAITGLLCWIYSLIWKTKKSDD